MTRRNMDTKDFVHAGYALQNWFRSQGISPAESVLVYALLNAMWMRDARREGKEATVDIYTEAYRSGLELWDDFVEAALEGKPK